jgi:hypothetical protein
VAFREAVEPKREAFKPNSFGAENDTRREWANKSHPRNQKRFHSRYNFGYGILLYMRKTADFCPFTAHFGGFEGVFPY